MCGIAGVVNLNQDHGAPVLEVQIRRMLAMLRHRGPDQFGIYLNQGVGLGNARLSIIDLGGGQQPISNEDETLWVVFNGEIFNYVELRAELEARGHRFSTHCDTEVLVHLYEEYGTRCLSKLNGQFVFAIWNEKDRSFFMARDRVGVRPLFYAHAENSLLFGSEIKALLADRRLSATIDPVALDQTFTYWSTLGTRTAFQGIHSLPPGHFLLLKGGEARIQPFWSLDFSQASRNTCTMEEAREELERLLTDATRIRLRADVPVGAYLSGGLDSSIIAAIVRHLGVSRLETFSIAFNDRQFDESEFQRGMARFLGTQHNVVEATHADIGRVFPEVVWHTEAPLTRTAPAPMFLLSRLVRKQNFKVVLTGEGADEFLAGYDIFKEAKIRRFWAANPKAAWRGSLFKRLYPDIADLAKSGSSFLSAFFGHGLQETNDPCYSHSIRWRNNRRNCRFFSEELNSAIGAVPAESPSLPPEFNSWGPLEQAQYIEASVFLSQYLLSSQGDRVGMANSIEGRYPFLDVRVMEFCMRLPSKLKMPALRDKFLLRQVAKKYLPAEITHRRKRPYRAPIHRSFINDEKLPYVYELLSPGAVRAAGLFKPEAVSQLVSKIEGGKPLGETDDMALVGVLSSQLIWQQFVQGFRPAAPLGERDDVKVVVRGREPVAASA